jgi:hypothetical protein
MLAELRMDIAGERNVLKAAGTFGSRRLSSTEARYETAPEFRHRGEGGGLTTVVHYDKGGPFLIVTLSGSKSQSGVWMSSHCRSKPGS